MSKRLELLIASGPAQGRRIRVGSGGVRLGRSSSNDVQLTDEGLSRNHCLFEPSGDGGLRVTDLASANGTFVNGEQLGVDPRELSEGDAIEAGSSTVVVVAEGAEAPPPKASAGPQRGLSGGSVDLGLDPGVRGEGAPAPHGASSPGAAPADSARRSPVANILWAVAAVAVAAATAVILYAPRGDDGPAVRPVDESAEPQMLELSYEKVEADASRIYRFLMTVDQSGVLRVAYDDVPGENRHVDKKKKLEEPAMRRIREILDTPGFSLLDSEYGGRGASDGNSLSSYRIRTVGWDGVRDVLVENTQEPDAFRQVREALEAFSRNELGIWAIRYSREKLLELSSQSASVGDAKWDERDVEYGNVSAAIKAYREAVFYLDTINPKPDGYAAIKHKLSRAEEELRRRYEDQRFLADKALNLGDWEQALVELRILCGMVPEKDDPRNAEANAKLVDIENRIKKARAGR